MALKWNENGMVVKEDGDRTLLISYASCRGAIQMLEDGSSGDTVCQIFNLTREELGFMYCGYLNGEFIL